MSQSLHFSLRVYLRVIIEILQIILIIGNYLKLKKKKRQMCLTLSRYVLYWNWSAKFSWCWRLEKVSHLAAVKQHSCRSENCAKNSHQWEFIGVPAFRWALTRFSSFLFTANSALRLLVIRTQKPLITKERAVNWHFFLS